MGALPKWTPGPWITDYEGINEWYINGIEIIDEANRRLIAVVYIGERFDEESEGRANAELIKMAPDLYKACVKALEAFAWARDFVIMPSGAQHEQWVRQAHEAIATLREVVQKVQDNTGMNSKEGY